MGFSHRASIVLYIAFWGGMVAAPLESQTTASPYRLSSTAVFLQSPVQAQAPTPGQTAKPQKLNINVIEGAGAVNNVNARTPQELAVEVDDENDHPVAGAMVTFFAPNEGAGGSFVGDSHLLTVMTGNDGRAIAKDFRANDVAGDYKIQVTATLGDQVASTTISQSNQVLAEPAAAKHPRMSGKKIGLIVAVGAAAAVGAAVGLGHGGSSSSGSSSTQTATIGVGGSPTVGAPH